MFWGSRSPRRWRAAVAAASNAESSGGRAALPFSLVLLRPGMRFCWYHQECSASRAEPSSAADGRDAATLQAAGLDTPCREPCRFPHGTGVCHFVNDVVFSAGQLRFSVLPLRGPGVGR